jgi:hypothetical protein
VKVEGIQVTIRVLDGPLTAIPTNVTLGLESLKGEAGGHPGHQSIKPELSETKDANVSRGYPGTSRDFESADKNDHVQRVEGVLSSNLFRPFKPMKE